MATKKPNRGLGRGLSALMADVQTDAEVAHVGSEVQRKPDMLIPIENVEANPDQPRRRFTPEGLEDLANSIREKGIIQPLIVRPHPAKEGAYEIVAGERRWRAAQVAQLHEVPAIIRGYNDTEALEVAIIENIQRADLNPIEEAAGYRDLMEKFGHTQEKLAEALGKSRSHIANMMRLLNLPEEVLEMVVDGRLSAGAARAIITAENPIELARRAVKEGLSVRDIERLAKSPTSPKKQSTPAQKAQKDADTVALEKSLSAASGMKVSIDHKDGDDQGTVTIRYATLDQFDDLCRMLGGDV
ncbi:ParB family chromosome partitioning protein [Maritimibacter alkaliphilus HTCC2654]|uniref:Chromosome partitioning protein parB n=1 Tax=Maritimibacter alkaliphilus HTCC2654 TaxID=314271 RepID=A3VD68_9RHOB|nr:ParB/RepB/Spo0J family partition protein [Maritimibacter alkaliphilus]EAQ14099.1 chromosome partitioning protein parB [Maritimibacter alkaliphilus HTCC2654]TYP84291.1 ParB family chromosome partitioning protein [Maritimibacter alkaliphilus HTCC2654]